MARSLFAVRREEIIGLCQRVLVMREGSLVGELRGAGISEGAILRLCYAA
jgi:ABC-type sugar transport system ATPase subunit